jgi:hypothetical protein
MTEEELDEKLNALWMAINDRNWSDAIAFLAHLAVWCHEEFARDEKLKDIRERGFIFHNRID